MGVFAFSWVSSLFTRTHRPGFGSAALDSGDPGTPGTGGTTCEATDQRGVARPQDSDGVIGARCDIGAFEEDDPLAETTQDWGDAPREIADTHHLSNRNSGHPSFIQKNLNCDVSFQQQIDGCFR
jgi:hypothetical protein